MDIKLFHKQTTEKKKNVGDAAIPFTSRLWPGAVIPYTFAKSIGKFRIARVTWETEVDPEYTF